MSLATLRTEFRVRTGDLNIIDADIDNYINRGIKFLDALTDYTHAPAKHFAVIPINTLAYTFSSNCRAAHKVYLIDAMTGRTEIDKITQAQMRTLYPDSANSTSGKPIYYTIDEVRSYPDTFDKTLAANVPYAKYINTAISNWTTRGIDFNCPTDKEYMIEIDGLFNHPELTDVIPAVTDNWWTVQYPEAVMLSAMYHMELTYRNSEGANDYLIGMRGIIDGIDKDRADEESHNTTQMLG